MAEDIRGLPATFASIRLWDETAFAYADMLVCQRDADVRTELLGLHAPPMVIIRNVRFGSEAPRHPDPATARWPHAHCNLVDRIASHVTET